jgi:hypothetical protein
MFASSNSNVVINTDMQTIVSENLTKVCTLHVPITLNHALKDLKKELELQGGKAPTIESLILELITEGLAARKANQRQGSI